MAADAAIKANISGDASGLIAALETAKQGVAKFGTDAANVLQRKLGMKDVFKGVLQGIGIASVGQIADKLVAPFKAAAEAAEDIAKSTERAANATERLIALRQTDNQQLATAEKTMERMQRLLETKKSEPVKNSFFGGLIQRGSAFDKLLGLSSGADDARAKEIQSLTAEIGEQAVKVEEKTASIKKRNDTEELRMAKELLSEDEKRAESAKKLAEFDRARLREKMPAEERIKSLEGERLSIAAQIAKYEQFTREGGKLTNQGNEELLGLKSKQLELEKEIAEATKDKAEAEKMVGNAITSNIAQWKEFKVLVSRTGRDDTDLSDRELQRKKANIEKDLFEMQRAGRETGAYQGGDYFQRLELNAVNQELALRQKVRTYTATFGEDRAFQLAGVSERRFSEINQTNTKQDEANNLLRDIKRRLDGGILTLPTNVIQGGG